MIGCSILKAGWKGMNPSCFFMKKYFKNIIKIIALLKKVWYNKWV